MMNNKVTLVFDDDIIGLAGYEYGDQIYQKQVMEKIDTSKDFYIEIPSKIQFVASSFVQGFFSKLMEEIGLSLIESRAKILSENENIKNNFLKKLM